MKKNAVLLFILIQFIRLENSSAQAPDWTRVLQVSTFGLQKGSVVTADANYVYTAGSISGPITLEGTSFTSVGNRDMIIVKASNNGVTSWVRHINAQVKGFLNPDAIKVDAGQNVYVSGVFTGTARIGSSTITSGELYNAFIAKFDINGNGVWARAFMSTGAENSEIALDDSGNSYLLSKSTKLLKFNSSGVKQWEQSFVNLTLQAIAIFGSNLYIGGSLQRGITNFGALTLSSWDRNNKGFIVKANLDGDYSNSFTVEGSTFGEGSTISDIVVDLSGDLFITGSYTKDLTLGTVTITNPSESYFTYIAKCDSDFTFDWAKSSSSFSDPLADRKIRTYRLFIDNLNNIYEYGWVNCSFTYGTVPITPNGDQFIVKFDVDGNAINSVVLQNTSNERTCITPEGKILSAGSYDYDGATFYGNLYINLFNPDMSLDWRKISTNTQSGMVGFNYVKHDNAGNTFFQSTARGNCNFFGTLINSDNNVTVNAKLDVNGNLVWLNQVADKLQTLGGNFYGPRFTLDKDNNVLTVGRFGTSISIGNQTFINQNTSDDGYVLKYNTNGQLIWAIQLHTNGQYEIYGITSDNAGNIIVSGEFKSQITILGQTISAGIVDGAFILKFDVTGSLLWAKGYPIGKKVWSAMVSTDGNNNIYMGAEIESPTDNLLTFGAITEPQVEVDATVLVKFDPNGNPQWVKTYGRVLGDPNSWSWPCDIKTDAEGNSYIWGGCQNNAVFGATTLNNPIGDIYSFYLTKINSTGDVVWANAIYEKTNSFSTVGFNYGDLLDLDDLGNIYVGGHFKELISVEGKTFQSEIGNDFFVAKYSNNGVFQWIKIIPSDLATQQTIRALSVFNDDVLTIAGSAGINLTLGSYEIIKKGGSSCIIATLGNLPFITVSSNILAIAAPASSTNTLDIVSNTNWSISSNQSWLTLSSSNGSGNSTITLTATANLSTSARTANVTVSGEGIPSKTVTVTQGAALPFLTVSTNDLSLPSIASNTYTFEISSNVNWVGISNQNWLTLSVNAGFGNDTIVLNSIANSTIESRIATINVYGAGVPTQTITTAQEAGTTEVNQIYLEESITIYPNPSIGKFTLDLNNFSENNITVTVSSMLGNVVKEFTVKNASTSYTQEIDLGNQSSGIYFITIKSSNRKVVKSIVIANP